MVTKLQVNTIHRHMIFLKDSFKH